MPDGTMDVSEAYRLTRELLDQQGLSNWTVSLDQARRRAGECRYGKRQISLSAPLLAQRTHAASLNTIRHEVAHALVGSRHNHDEVWAATHRRLGGDGKRCFQHVDEQSPWVGTCEHGQEFSRYRAPKRMSGWRCRCTPTSSPVVWRQRTTAPVAAEPRAMSALEIMRSARR